MKELNIETVKAMTVFYLLVTIAAFTINDDINIRNLIGFSSLWLIVRLVNSKWFNKRVSVSE